ncbi:universal stress family protein [Burkholderia thailandensis 2002721723]|nr:universal stress family protein [Burkholderia thailandensis 2002721723]
MYSIILVALDGSETASHALDAALQLAVDTGARLVPVYVVDMPVFAFDTPGYDPSILIDAFREEGRRVLDDAQARMTRAAWPARRGSSRSSRRARTSPSASSARRARSARV